MQRRQRLFRHWLHRRDRDVRFATAFRGCAGRSSAAKLAGHGEQRPATGCTIDGSSRLPSQTSACTSGVRVTQDAHPQPPVAVLPGVHVDLQWLALLRGRVVADCLLDSPAFHLDLRQLRTERDDDMPLARRGWQDLVELYRIKVNNLTVRNAALTYVDADPERPLRITAADGEALNIRHVTGRNEPYPSPVRLAAILFDGGKLEADGDADFLRRPHAAFRGRTEVAGMPLEALGPVIGNYQVQVSGGLLSARGEVEYAPGLQHVRLSEVLVDDISVDYVSPAGSRARAAGQAIVDTATDVEESPQADLLLDRLQLRDARLDEHRRRASIPSFTGTPYAS